MPGDRSARRVGEKWKQIKKFFTINQFVLQMFCTKNIIRFLSLINSTGRIKNSDM
jgi:hypothetical protein